MEMLRTSESAQAEARGDLAQHLRFLLARADLTPRKLAVEHDLPYRMGKLYRFFSGELLPPPLLIDVVARHCPDPQGLYSVYERASKAAVAAPGNAEKNAGKEWFRRGLLFSSVTVLKLGVVAGAVLVAAVVVGGLGQRLPSGPSHRPPPPAVPGSPAPGSSTDRQAPSSHREHRRSKNPSRRLRSRPDPATCALSGRGVRRSGTGRAAGEALGGVEAVAAGIRVRRRMQGRFFAVRLIGQT